MTSGPLASNIIKGWILDGDVSDQEIIEAIRNNPDTAYLQVGTCRMGSDVNAVVDPQLRVNGIEGLRVLDASIMPHLISANTNAATIMTAEKTADLIKASR